MKTSLLIAWDLCLHFQFHFVERWWLDSVLVVWQDLGPLGYEATFGIFAAAALLIATAIAIRRRRQWAGMGRHGSQKEAGSHAPLPTSSGGVADGDPASRADGSSVDCSEQGILVASV